MTDGFDLVIRAPRAISGDGEIAAAVGVREGSVAAVIPLDRAAAARSVLELDASVVLMPGLVDSHVHICEPGNTEWEGFAAATKAAAAGGITTLVDRPLDSVPSTVSVAALEAKREAAAGQCHVDVGFWDGVIPGSLGEVAPPGRWRRRSAFSAISSPPAGSRRKRESRSGDPRGDRTFLTAYA